MSFWFKGRYPAGSELGDKLLAALVEAQDWDLAAGLRDELDEAAKKRSTAAVIRPKLAVADRQQNC